MKEYEEKYPDKIHVHQNEKNLGFVQNFLEGARRASGSYLMFCDQDDVWLSSKLGDALNYIRKMEQKYGEDKPISVFTDAKVVDSSLLELHPSFYKASNLDTKKLDLPHVLMENKMIGCTIIFNRRVLDFLEVLPKSARYHDWWIAIITSCFGQIGYFNKGTLLYRQHEKNVVGNQSFVAYVKNRLYSLRQQRKVLIKTQGQASNFYEIFRDQLSENEKTIISKFKFGTRKLVFEKIYRDKIWFFQNWVIRNIGLLLII